MANRALSFGDLSPETKLIRIKSKFLTEISGCEKMKHFVSRQTDLENSYLPCLLLLLEEEFSKRDALTVTSMEDLESLQEKLDEASTRIENLEKKVDFLVKGGTQPSTSTQLENSPFRLCIILIYFCSYCVLPEII